MSRPTQLKPVLFRASCLSDRFIFLKKNNLLVFFANLCHVVGKHGTYSQAPRSGISVTAGHTRDGAEHPVPPRHATARAGQHDGSPSRPRQRRPSRTCPPPAAAWGSESDPRGRSRPRLHGLVRAPRDPSGVALEWTLAPRESSRVERCRSAPAGPPCPERAARGSCRVMCSGA